MDAGPVWSWPTGSPSPEASGARLDEDLATDHEVVLVDLPGHGGSSGVRPGSTGGGPALADAGGPADYLGYSLGARVCLHLALARPDLVRRLVLVSGTAGIEDVDERAGAPVGRRGPGRRARPARRWTARGHRRRVRGPLGGPTDVRRHAAGANGLAERKRNTASGLASSLRLAGTGTQEPLWDRLGGLGCRCWWSSVRATPSSAPSAGDWWTASAPAPPWSSWTGADHAPHLQRPGEVAAAVRPSWPAESAGRHRPGRRAVIGTARGQPGTATSGARVSHSASARVAPNASCSRPVAASAGRRARPSAPAEGQFHRHPASGRATSGEEREHRQERSGHAGDGQNAPQRHTGEGQPTQAT